MEYSKNIIDFTSIVSWSLNDGWEYAGSPTEEELIEQSMRGRSHRLFKKHCRTPLGQSYIRYLHLLRGQTAQYNAKGYLLIHSVGMWGAWVEHDLVASDAKNKIRDNTNE